MALDQSDWVPPEVDTKQANVARVYDYWLGGNHNFLADQDVARAITAIEPNAAAFARANRQFLGRAVRYLTTAGIRQFLDIGSGIPTEGNVHQVAGQADPQARVVYVDVDPVAVAHSKTLLSGNPNAAVIQADLRDPQTILTQVQTRRLIDPAQPTGLLLVAVLHFLSDAEDPWQKVAALRRGLHPAMAARRTRRSRRRPRRPVGRTRRRRAKKLTGHQQASQRTCPCRR